MTLKITLIIIFIAVVLLIVLPFALYLSGVEVFDFSGGGRRDVTEPERILLRSSDGGERWASGSKSEDKDTPFPSRITIIEAHPFRPNDLFMGSFGAGLWKSANLGETWKKVSDENGVLDSSADVYAVAISPSNTDIMYIGVLQQKRGRVLKSEDGGRHFREIYAASVEEIGVYDVYVNPSIPDNVTIVTGQGGLLDSDDGGRTWKVRQWFSQGLTRYEVNPLDASEQYVIMANGDMQHTIDGGKRWENLKGQAGGGDLGIQYPPPLSLNPFGGFSGTAAKVFEIDPQNPSTLYIGSQEGLLRSTTSGLTWERMNILIPPSALPVDAVAVHPFEPRIIFAVADAQLHRTDDSGVHWRMKLMNILGRTTKLIIHPLRPEIMFAIIGR